MATSVNDEHPGLGQGLGRLEGKVAVVTAADSGIGRATARLFAREGASVVCVDRDERGKPRVDRLIEGDGGQAAFILGDASANEACEEMVATAVDRFGGLDVLFLNAGTGVRAPIHETSEEQWTHVIETNLYSVYRGLKAALPVFLEQGHGNVVITASSLGLLGVRNYPAYCATKAGLINLTRQLSFDYGPEIRVNCVCPGPIDTARVREFPPRSRPVPLEGRESAGDAVKGLHRLGRAEEVAYPVLFLASEESSFITGHALVVDGGQTVAV